LSADEAARAPGRPGPEVRATERWFIRRGLPMFVEDYSAGRDVWTRALPALAVLFVIMVLGFIGGTPVDDEDVAGRWDRIGQVLFVVVVAVFLVGYVLWNRRRGARWYALPDSVGWPWLLVFVGVPALLSLTPGNRSVAGVVGGFAVPLLLLGIVYVTTRYALVALTAWAFRWTFGSLYGVTELVTRVLPLMLLVLTFLAMNAGVWQAMGSSNAEAITATLVLLGIVGVLFIVNRARREFDDVEQSTGREGVVEAAEGTPLAGLVGDLPDLDRRVPMTQRQRVNVHLVMVVAQIVQVALIGLVVWLFFVIFTAVAIRLPVQQNWLKDLGGIGRPLLTWGDGHGLTRAAVRVSAFLGGFAAFYATVYAASDKVYRKYFAERISHDLSRALAVRRAYLALRRRAGLPAPDPVPAEPDPS
jgi:hypothetical protein